MRIIIPILSDVSEETDRDRRGTGAVRLPSWLLRMGHAYEEGSGMTRSSSLDRGDGWTPTTTAPSAGEEEEELRAYWITRFG